MLKKIAYPGSYYDYAGFEAWLSDRSAEGMRLESFSSIGMLPVFRKTQPRRVRYFVLPDLKKKGDCPVQLYAEQGWNHVVSRNGEFHIFETEDPWAVKPKVEFEESDWNRKWRRLWSDLLFWIFSILLTTGQAVSDFLLDWSYYERITYWSGFLFLGWLIPIALFWPGFSKFYDILVWNRCHRRKDDTEPWQGMVLIRWGEIVMFWGLLVTILVALLSLGASSRQTYDPLRSVNRDLPLVTLDVLEEEIHYAPEPYGPGIDVNFRRWPLVPQEIHIKSIGLWEDPGTVEDWVEADHIRNYDARLDFSYYHLLTDGMARRMIEEEISDFQEESYDAVKSAVIEMQEGFDSAWVHYDSEYQTLWAREGDVVIRCFYTGSGEITEHLREIYDIVMTYRD